MRKPQMHTGDAAAKRPFTFLLLVFILSVPCWLLSFVTGVVTALKVPVGDLAITFVPLIAGTILIYKHEGWPGVRSFLARTFDFKRAKQKKWLAIPVLLPALIYLLTFLAMHLYGRTATVHVNGLQLLILLVLFFLGAAGEELGWMGYAFGPLSKRFGPLTTAFIIAIPWWLWHFPSILQIGGDTLYIAWWLPGAIGLRILMIWLYIKTGHSVFAVILFHACVNAGRTAVYPTVGTHYDPAYMATGYTIVAVMAILVMVFHYIIKRNDLQT